MNTYKIRVQPTAWATSELAHEALAQLLDGKLRKVVRAPEGGFHVAFERRESDHVAAFNDVFVALQQLGYQAIEADVTEWVDQIVETAIVGGLGGGTLASGSENGELMLFAALVGALAGAIAGSRLRNVKAVYEVVPVYPAGWTLQKVTPPARATAMPQVAPSG
jgi:hypothetical protein